ncbi:MAG: hypothetical protein IJ760_08300 [Bacteroidales bacterium]|nr:hypothetical protein [Bacteroidales bacterium]
MAEIDDDLMEVSESRSSQLGAKFTQLNPTTSRAPTPQQMDGINTAFRIVHYVIDAGMLAMSFWTRNQEGIAPWIFCIALILWLSYRLLYFQRGKIVDNLMGFFLFAATIIFFIFFIHEKDDDYIGNLLLGVVYLGFFCAWGAIRQKRKENEHTNK